jgi:colicin import membrane protein
MTAAVFDERAEPGALASAFLAALVHIALLAFLVLGVRWQNPPPEPVSAELWDAPQAAPPPAPAAKAEPPPPAAAPKPESRIEKPDIEVKAPPPKPKPEPPKSAPRPEPPRIAPKSNAEKAAPKPPVDADVQRRLREELAREQQQLALEHERAAIRDSLARDAAAERARALATWVDRIRAKIRGNILLPPDLKGNPEAIFDVVQLPTGEVLSVKLRKSSGHAGYDQAVERAILKSSPLPRPDRPELFQRELELRFRPLDR